MIAALVVVFIVQTVKVEGRQCSHDCTTRTNLRNKLILLRRILLAQRLIEATLSSSGFQTTVKSYIKRVIGLPGDTIEVHEGIVRVNERDLDENISIPGSIFRTQSGAVPVRQITTSSWRQPRQLERLTDLGIGSKKYIYGKALFRYWPLGEHLCINAHENVCALPLPNKIERLIRSRAPFQ